MWMNLKRKSILNDYPVKKVFNTSGCQFPAVTVNKDIFMFFYNIVQKSLNKLFGQINLSGEGSEGPCRLDYF